MMLTSYIGIIILSVVSCLMLTVLYLLVNTKTLMLAMELTYEFTNRNTIPYFTYWTYSHMDLLFC